LGYEVTDLEGRYYDEGLKDRQEWPPSALAYVENRGQDLELSRYGSQ
jgi:hypothetical protein